MFRFLGNLLRSESARSVKRKSRRTNLAYRALGAGLVEHLEDRIVLSTTVPVVDAATGEVVSSSAFRASVEFNGQLYFTSSMDGELWKYDPSTQHSARIADINPGSEGSLPQLLTIVDGRLYFKANDGVHGEELWMHDPGTQSTELVEDIYPGASGSNITARTGATD